MKRVLVLLLMASLSLGHAQRTPQPQRMNLLYDPAAASSLRAGVSKNLMLTVTAAVKRATPQLQQRCQGAKFIPPTDPIIKQTFASAGGSFTRQNAKQTAWLYEACHGKQETSVFVTGISEGAALVNVVLMEIDDVYAGVRDFYSVRDVNSNGLSELAVVWGSGDGCCSELRAELMEWTNSAARGVGSLPLAWYQGGDFGEDQEASYAYTAYVQKAPKPVFVGVEYRASSRVALLSLAPSIIKFTPIK